jgi:hypothetical protein
VDSVIAGLIVAGFGLIWVLFPNLPRLGRLPGDIVIERGNSRFYFPDVLSIVISVVLSLAKKPSAWSISKQATLLSLISRLSPVPSLISTISPM